MKKLALYALAILLACVVTTPASAQSHRRTDNRRGYQYGYSGTALEAVTARNMGMISGIIGELGYGRGDHARSGYYDDRYNRYDRYGRGLSRNEAIGAAVLVGGGLLINAVANRHRADENSNNTEEPSKCFERVVKNARKQHVELAAAEAMAFCSGQPLQQPAPEPQPATRSASGIVTNETGECVVVDGQRLERGQHMGVDDAERIGISTERGSSCRVTAQFNRQNGISLFCK